MSPYALKTFRGERLVVAAFFPNYSDHFAALSHGKQQRVENGHGDQGQHRAKGQPAHDRHRHLAKEVISQERRHADNGGACRQQHRAQAAHTG